MSQATSIRLRAARVSVERLSSTALVMGIRAKAAAKAIAQFTKTLHEDQPLVAANATYLCHAFFGDVRLDLYGNYYKLRSRIIVDLDDATIAGTQISLRDALSGKQWNDLHRQAQIAIEEGM